MLPRDVFARTIEHPFHFSNDRIDPENYFQFSKSLNGSGDYVLSVVSRFQLSDVSQVHLFGAGVAEGKNNRHRSDHSSDPDQMRKYIGFYDFFAECILEKDLANYRSAIKYRPEGGQTAHFQVELYWKGSGSKKDQKECRRTARGALYDGCFGPEVYPIARTDSALIESINGLEEKPRK